MPNAQIATLFARLVAARVNDAVLKHTSQADFEAANANDAQCTLEEGLKFVQHDAATFRVLCEIVFQLDAEVEAMRKIEAKWDAALDQARPDLRDVVAAAAALAPTYMASSGPLRRMYIEAIRGSFAPEIYEFSRGPEIMTALLKAGIRPDDIEVLDKLSQTTADFLMLTKALTGDLEDVKLEAYERLAAGGFIDIVNKAITENGHKIFITHRTEATSWNVTVRITERGRKLLVMMKAGRGQ